MTTCCSASSRLEYNRTVGMSSKLAWKPGGVGQDLSSYTFYMDVREDLDVESELLFRLTSDEVTGDMVVFDPDQATNPGVFTLVIPPEDQLAAQGVTVPECWPPDAAFDLIAVDSLGARTIVLRGWTLLITGTTADLTGV